jgi:alpha-beta hydrolase superfamily lysophospholipase
MAVEEVQRQFPTAPLFAVGYSLGAVILTKYLAEADSGHWRGQGRTLWTRLIDRYIGGCIGSRHLRLMQCTLHVL